jgi:hypothetical protein
MTSGQFISEDLVVFIWKFQLFNHHQLQTKSGKPLTVLNQGQRQFDSGPDFSNASIKIDELTLVGNVEIHSVDEDWVRHHHQNDAAYNTVILHVVWDAKNAITHLQNDSTVEILELKNFDDASIIERYKSLMRETTKVPCEKANPEIDSFVFSSFLTNLAIERLERKVADIESLKLRYQNDWDQILFIYLSRYLGSKLNNDALQQLSENIPVKVLFKSLHNPKSIEAILFGQSGLLDRDIQDEYFNSLQTEYKYQKRLHNLKSINGVSLKFSKIRPAAFPSFRLAQLAAVVSSGNFSFDKIISFKSHKQFELSLEIKEHTYWQYHYDFKSKQTRKHNFAIGKSTLQMLSINILIPMLFAYGKYKQDEVYCERAIQFLEQIEYETNSIVSQFDFLSYKLSNALESQALIQLKSEYCNAKKCLDCYVGNQIFRN